MASSSACDTRALRPTRKSAVDISRREFLRLMGGAGGAPALTGLIASGVSLAPTVARAQALRIKDAKTTPSVCPYCSVGCATLVHTIEGKIVNIEGDPRSPHNEGCLCPKGAAIFQLHVNPNRPTQVLHRAPGAAEWEVWDLERAMNRVAELVKKTRDETFVERLPNGKLVNMTPSVFSLGGATLEIEFNHIQQKLMRGLGIVAIENQARI
jgi:formate dehydrogenase major subunit